jgi:hypothetical protein
MKRTIILLSVLLLMTVQLFASGNHEKQIVAEPILEKPIQEEPILGESILYVNASSTAPSPTGKSWENAFSDLQVALAQAEAGDQIWVAKGTYYPSLKDKTIQFVMKDEVDVYGGFAGNEKTLKDRDWVTNETILSGNIGDKNSSADNSLNVVVAANSIIDGFTIREGNGANRGSSIPTMNAQTASSMRPLQGSNSQMQGPPPQGSGNMQGPPPQAGSSTANTTTASNSLGHSSPSMLMGSGISYGNGAGILIWQTSPTIRNCVITSNSAGKAGGIYIVGQGMARPNQDTSTIKIVSPLFVNCTISDNVAVMRGGGVSLDLGASATFVDCVFSNNVCEEGKGGAVYNDFGCSPSFENCLFVNNNAESGGAMANDGSSNPFISNSTFYGNSADVTSAALYQGTGPFNDPIVVNSIIWGNSCEEDVAGIYSWNDSNPSISYSIVEDGYEGEAILDVDPQFVDAENGNFSLLQDSVALTAGSNGKRIGYDASLVGSRSEKELASLVKIPSLPDDQQEVVILSLSPATITSIVAKDGVVFVDSQGKGNGSSWENATASLQDAINYANIQYEKNGSLTEIWVKAGTYTAGTVRSDSFTLQEGASLYGGFSGKETKLEQRSYSNNPTILSGEIGDASTTSDNVYHVLIGSDHALLDGFVITGGYADKADGGQVYDDKGGAILNYAAGSRVRPDTEPTLGYDLAMKNCLFVDNYAIEGGAVYTYHGGNPTFDNCDFYQNSALYGGAVVDRAGVNSIYTDCTFTGNSALYKGGAAFVDYGSMATFESCLFQMNQAGSNGGAMYIIDRASQEIPNETDFAKIDPTWTSMTDIFSSVLVQDCQFANNEATLDGAVAFVYEGSKLMVENSVFTGNVAGREADTVMLLNKSVLYLVNDQVIDGVAFDETSSRVLK